MRITRRGWLGGAALIAGASGTAGTNAATPSPSPHAAAATLPAGPVRVLSRGDGHDYGPALDALRDYARAELAAIGLPGMTLSVTDASGFAAVLTLGWADRERAIPVKPAHAFQIGSISKSFVALTVLALADQGLINVDAPLSTYLPDAALPSEPITAAHLLSHTSGLPNGAPPFPRTPDGRLWCGFAPGSHFSYSNTGYVLLGLLIERVTGEPHQAVVKRLVRDKLRLGDLAGTLSQTDRGRFAVGYWPWDRTSAAVLPRTRLEPAAWNEEDTAAGSIGATSGQMTLYLRALMQIAQGKGAPVLSDAAARRFVAPVIATDEFGPGAHYACGVSVVPIDGAACLHHTGGMMAFSSAFHADPAAGVACFASVNARNEGYRPRVTTAYAVRLMRAVRAGKPLPEAPDPLAPYRFKDPAPFLGTFVGPGGHRYVLASAATGVTLTSGGQTHRVIPQGPRRLVTDHPMFSAYGLDAMMEGGKATGFWWGETLFGRDSAPAQPAPSAALQALAGAYLNRDPWVGGGAVVVRGDALVVEGLGRIVDRGGWWSAEPDVGGVERLRFEALLNGKAQRLSLSGADLLRLQV